MVSSERSESWRRRLGLNHAAASGGFESAGGSMESVDDAGTGDPRDRVRLAREKMRERVLDDFGGDPALLEAVDAIQLSGEEALAVLGTGEREPDMEQFAALEAVVAFDGTRPSFLVKDGAIDLGSSFSTSQWKTTLAPRLDDLAAFAASVARVEIGEDGIGTAFLVTPTLAITNRHVAQLIADFDAGGAAIRPGVFLDFGREHAGRASYDRREVVEVLGTGANLIVAPINHGKLDLALIRVSPSRLRGEPADRALKLKAGVTELAQGEIVAAVGYPADWRNYTPRELRTQFDEVLAKLLDGDAGSKRLAPGVSGGMLTPDAGASRWTAEHDATTVNGNSGSPLAVLGRAGPVQTVGLHYGGRWQSANWAHVLGACANAPLFPGNRDLRSVLADHGIVL